ncbi:MAG: hypothetical protein NTY12_04635 [Candidatus Falkowbacteria bacterium]|nr:hypothetical protein [Candidatus Falkowbacteria bacterium]
MKKILFALIAFSLVFGTVAMAKEGEKKADKPVTMVEVKKEQEKISSPDDVVNFTNIVKKGKELFGMRKIILEKITHPSEIEHFEKVKKLGNALWGMRKDDNQALVRPEAASCVKTAFDKRDATLKSGITTGTTTLLSTIDTRTTCQKAALDKTTVKEQKEANKVCVETFKKAIESGKEATKKYRDNVWQTFNSDLKACNLLQASNVPANTTSTDIKIEDGGLGMEF